MVNFLTTQTKIHLIRTICNFCHDLETRSWPRKMCCDLDTDLDIILHLYSSLDTWNTYYCYYNWYIYNITQYILSTSLYRSPDLSRSLLKSKHILLGHDLVSRSWVTFLTPQTYIHLIRTVSNFCSDLKTRSWPRKTCRNLDNDLDIILDIYSALDMWNTYYCYYNGYI